MISDPFEFMPGTTPLLVSMPHSGLQLTDAVASGLTASALQLADTDWFIPELYSFLNELGVGVIRANYSRYVLDLNRSLDDKPLYTGKVTGLFPDISFTDDSLFLPGQEPDEEERERYKQQIWRPYHQQIRNELDRLKAVHGNAMLFDAHSIAPRVPMLFDGRLPDFNFGTNSGASCRFGLTSQLEALACADGRFTCVTDGRFKGGFITRHFGQPAEGIESLQLELSQGTYLADEAFTAKRFDAYQIDPKKLSHVQPLLRQITQHLLDALQH
ncbi:N-formylglutamate deformylase [Aliamphritea spongicola]|uniref:N-formylglutamate deformylase n=1 Tax=Aliamphritea spongicola TaxID=707589 RepID=UPI0030133217